MWIIIPLLLIVQMTSGQENVCAARGTANCAMTPEQTEGPYFLSDAGVPERKDVREGRNGSQLDLTLIFQDIKRCTPIENLNIYIWNTDARGEYSGFQQLMTRARNQPLDGTRYMRGHQKTDCNGQVEFITILPGWYPGRTSHVHIESFGGTDTSAPGLHTTQVYFEEKITVEAETSDAAYKSNPNTRKKNADDSIFTGSGGPTLLLKTEYKNGKDISGGLKARYVLGINSGATAPTTTTTSAATTGMAALVGSAAATHSKAVQIVFALCLGFLVNVATIV